MGIYCLVNVVVILLSFCHSAPQCFSFKIHNITVFYFFFDRQASLNEAAEKYYDLAAKLRPNVSTFSVSTIVEDTVLGPSTVIVIYGAFFWLFLPGFSVEGPLLSSSNYLRPVQISLSSSLLLLLSPPVTT